jgi:hypothetical protein
VTESDVRSPPAASITPRVEKELSKIGKRNSDATAVIESAAKYYVALKKLAAK